MGFCLWCGMLVIFRGRPARMYHIPSGWECWRNRTGSPPIGKFRSGTSRKTRAHYREETKELLTIYRRQMDPAPVIVYMAKHLRGRREDVVRDLFAHLIAEADAQSEGLLKTLLSSRQWQAFVNRKRK